MKIDFSPSLSFSFLLLFPPLQDYYYYYNTSLLLRAIEKRRKDAASQMSPRARNEATFETLLHSYTRIYVYIYKSLKCGMHNVALNYEAR